MEAMRQALETLERGGVIAIPTDTVYGLACRPDLASAVEAVYAIKRRPAGLELTLMAPGADSIRGLVQITPEAEELMRAFWPGSLSIILNCGAKRLAIPRFGDTLSVRVPGHPLLLQFLKESGPLATTSANRHGEAPATTAAEAGAALDGEVDIVLDGGRGGGQASTIIDCSVQPARLIREGPITLQQLQACLQMEGGTKDGENA